MDRPRVRRAWLSDRRQVRRGSSAAPWSRGWAFLPRYRVVVPFRPAVVVPFRHWRFCFCGAVSALGTVPFRALAAFKFMDRVALGFPRWRRRSARAASASSIVLNRRHSWVPSPGNPSAGRYVSRNLLGRLYSALIALVPCSVISHQPERFQVIEGGPRCCAGVRHTSRSR